MRGSCVRVAERDACDFLTFRKERKAPAGLCQRGLACLSYSASSVQQGACAMQQLPPVMQQPAACGATFDVALAVLISAATAIIMKYFIVPPC